MKLEPFRYLVDKTFFQFNEKSITNQNAHSQVENDEKPGAKYRNENDLEDTETNKTFAILKFMPKTLPEHEIVEGINSLNLKHMKIFNVVQTLATDYVKYNGHDVEPVHLFISCSGGTGKSHLVRVIYHAISKTLLYRCKEPEKPIALLLGPTGISTVNIGGTTIHSSLGIKPGTKLLTLNDKSKAASTNRLSEVKFLIIVELSMVLSDL